MFEFEFIIYVPVNNFKSAGFNQLTKQRIKSLVQGHNTVPPSATSQSQLKHSTTEPLCFNSMCNLKFNLVPFYLQFSLAMPYITLL